MTNKKDFVETLIDTLPRETSSSILSKQLLRSATSIGANFVEAQGSPTKKDFAQFMSIALKSANETRYWLSLFVRINKGNNQLLSVLEGETLELANILGAIVRSTRKTL